MISSVVAAVAGMPGVEGRRRSRRPGGERRSRRLGWGQGERKGAGIRGGRAPAEPSPGAGEEEPSPGVGARRAEGRRHPGWKGAGGAVARGGRGGAVARGGGKESGRAPASGV